MSSPVSIWNPSNDPSNLEPGDGINLEKVGNKTKIHVALSNLNNNLATFDNNGNLQVDGTETMQMVQDFLNSSGFNNFGEYRQGIVLNSHTSGFIKGGIFYTPKNNTHLPYTTTGDWDSESELFVVRGDDSLRQDLANEDNGANLIGGFSKKARESTSISSTLTVSVPYDFPDLQSAVDAFSRLKPNNNSKVNIVVEAGFMPVSGVDVQNRDCRHITILSEGNSIVTLAPGFKGASYLSGHENIFIRAWNSTPPALGCLVDAADNADTGYCLHDSSMSGRVLPGCGVINVDGVGLLAAYGSECDAGRSIFTGAKNQGLHCTTHSKVTASEADFSGVRGDSQSSCASVVRGSTAYLRLSKMNNAVDGYGVRASACARVDLQHCEIIGNFRGAIRATGTTNINAEDSKVQKGLDGAVLCVNGSSVNARTMVDETGEAVDISYFPLQNAFNIANTHGIIYGTDRNQILYGGKPEQSIQDLKSINGFNAFQVTSTAPGIFPSALSGDAIIQLETTNGIKHQIGLSRGNGGRLWFRSWNTATQDFNEWK